MERKHLKLVWSNNSVKKPSVSDNILTRDDLIAIDRAENIDKNNFSEVDVKELINGFDPKSKELYELFDRIYNIKVELHKLVVNDLTFKPYIMLFDIAYLNEEGVSNMELVLNHKDLTAKEKVEYVLQILEEYLDLFAL